MLVASNYGIGGYYNSFSILWLRRENSHSIIAHTFSLGFALLFFQIVVGIIGWNLRLTTTTDSSCVIEQQTPYFLGHAKTVESEKDSVRFPKFSCANQWDVYESKKSINLATLQLTFIISFGFLFQMISLFYC